MEQWKNKQDREQKIHPIQCSATDLRQLGIGFGGQPKHRFSIEAKNMKNISGAQQMLNPKKAFSSFSVNDIQKAKEFYGKTLGLELSSGPEGTLVFPLGGGAKALMYPKPNHQPA